MAKKLLPFIILVVSVVVAVGLVKTRQLPEQSEIIIPTTLVDVMAVNPQDAYLTVASQGTVEARTRTTLVSEVTGQVVEVSPDFVAGGFFRKGDVLLKLDDQDYLAAVSRAQASVASARSLLEQERGQADVAQREWDRMTAERQAQVRAKELYLRKPQLQEAQSRLESAQADLQQAQNDLSKTSIIAPYDGLISSKNSDIGQYVTAGTSLAEIFAVDYAEVRLPIPETKLAFLELPAAYRNPAEPTRMNGPEVELVSNIGNTRHRWTGKLVRTEGVLDTRTRVLFSVVQIEDPYRLYSSDNSEPLRIGTYVNATINGRQLNNVVIVPRHTLQANNVVWVADPEDRLRPRTVDVVTINGDNAYISGGFESGDRVVITRLENPLNGAPVQTNTLPFQNIQ